MPEIRKKLLLLFAFLFSACNQDASVSQSSSPNLNSNSAGYNGSASIPIPPTTASLVQHIQNSTSWTGNTGAASSCPNGVSSSSCNPPNAVFTSNIIQASDPAFLTGSDGTSGVFEVAQSPAWATAIWGHSVVTDIAARNFIWDFYLYVNGTNYYSSELDLYTSLNNGQRFMMGSQCNRSANTWDTWSEANQQWIQNASVPCNLVMPTNEWVHVIFYNTVDASANTYTYRTLQINGVDYVLNQTQSTKNVGWTTGLIGVQVQLDTNASGDGVNEYFENMQLYSW